MRSTRARSGFTLLEVMISTAILALSLSTIFGSSILASRGTAHARMVTTGGLLAQCRMTEVEAYLRVNGLPETDNQRIDDPPEFSGERCCDAPFTCAVRVDKIEMPQPQDVQTGAGDRLLNAASGAASGSSYNALGGGGGGDGGAPSAIGQLAGAFGALGASGSDPTSALAGALGGGTGGSGGGAGALSGAGAPNLQGMAAQLLSGLYPTLKPLLEGAIRKVTVTVAWYEGSRQFSFDVVQYFTNPGQTFQSGDSMNAIERALGGGATGTPGAGVAPGGTATGTPAAGAAH